MNFNLYNSIICEAECMLRGITQKMENITKEEWLNEYKIDACVSKSEEGIISFSKMIYSEGLKYQLEHQLKFKNIENAKERIDKVFSFIIDNKLPFEILELVFYASVSMIYFSMRKMSEKQIEEVNDLIIDFITKLTQNEKERIYLNTLNRILFCNTVYLYTTINCSATKDENEYKEEYEKLLDDARKIYPNGEVIELIKEILVVEEFFKEQTKENMKKVKRLCFDKEKNWMWHICTWSSPEKWSAVLPGMEYLPHISFSSSSDSKISVMEGILELKPERVRGHWGIPTEEQLEIEEQEFQEKWLQWEEESYRKIFMQPYEIHISESKGELIYTLLSVLADNMELEETKNSIVSDFTHSYGNYEIDNVYNIAKALNENPSKEELEDYGRELLLEYLNKQMMTKEIKMLRLEHKDNFSELFNVIVNSIDSTEKGIKVYEIIAEALKRVILRILLEAGNRRIEDIINKYESKGIDTYELLEQFEKSVIRGEQGCIDWVNNNMNRIRVEVSEEWNRLGFRRNSEGNVFLMSLFMELLFNMFTYGDINYEMLLTLDVATMDEEVYFVIKTENIVDESIRSNTKKGLAARNRILGKLNFGSEYRWKNSILKEYKQNNTKCVVSARMKADLFGGL